MRKVNINGGTKVGNIDMIKEEKKEYYNNGKLYFQYYLVNGRLEGEYKYWYDNGELWNQEFYVNGQREGEQINYYYE